MKKKNAAYKLAAYLFIVVLAAFGAVRAETASDKAATAAAQAKIAQDAARVVDRKGDLSLCKSENKVRIRTNRRDKSLEETATLVKDALLVISKARRTENDDNTNGQLRDIATRAAKIKTNFSTEKLSNCEERFEKTPVKKK